MLNEARRPSGAGTLKIRIAVRDKLPYGTIGDVVDLASSSLACVIGAPDVPGSPGIVTPVNHVGAVIDAIFPAVGNIASSYVVAQLRATRAGETQTAWEQAYTLKPSITAA